MLGAVAVKFVPAALMAFLMQVATTAALALPGQLILLATVVAPMVMELMT